MISNSFQGSGVRNRSHVEVGATIFPAYIVGGGTNVPDVTWLKDGEVARTQPTNSLTGDSDLRTIIIFDMMLSDAGVYQCVFTDTARSEVLVTIPLRIDTGEHWLQRLFYIKPFSDINSGEILFLEAESPTTIILRPPEALVLQVRTSGRYLSIQWVVNGVIPTTPERFVHFNEVYIRGTTTVSDLGLYEVSLALNSGQQAPDEVEFLVIESGNAMSQRSSTLHHVLYLQLMPIQIV